MSENSNNATSSRPETRSFKSNKSLFSSFAGADSSNYAATSSSSSSSNFIIDPNDQIWYEFLSSLNEPVDLQSVSNENDKQTPANEDGSSLKTSNVLLADNDDAADDPDFTVCLDNCDLDEPDWFQIPKKEAVELVKDAIEFCDGVPIVYDDHRNTKSKSNLNKKNRDLSVSGQSSQTSLVNESNTARNNKNTSEETNNRVNNIDKKESQCETRPVENEPNKTTQPTPLEFIPQFSQSQKKQLDEQLRNHVQLLTQTCLFTYCSKEFKHVFNEAANLLKVLDSLNKTSIEEEESAETSGLSKPLVCPKYEIINLQEAIRIVDEIPRLDPQLLNNDLKQDVPAKFLEIIVSSPVFYNTAILPNVSKFKYYSHFKRSQFSDAEKILLIMGFNKFKHLPKTECCECIREHLLPNRSCNDIKKQLSYMSSSEQRQLQLKELLKRQKKPGNLMLSNYEFSKQIHYKSPFEQADSAQLPTMYTIHIERLKMANIVKDARKHLPDPKEKKQKKWGNSRSTRMAYEAEKGAVETASTAASKENLNDSDQRAKTNETSFSNFETHEPVFEDNHPPPPDRTPEKSADNEILTSTKRKRTLLPPSSPKRRSPSPILVSSGSPSPEKQTPCARNVNIRPFQIRPINAPTFPLMSQVPVSTPYPSCSLYPTQGLHGPSAVLLPSTNFVNLLARPNQYMQNFQPNLVRPNENVINMAPLIRPAAVHQPVAPFMLPSNFNGTILFQPTIHIHTNDKNKLDLSKYRNILPKDPSKSNAANNNTNKKTKAD